MVLRIEVGGNHYKPNWSEWAMDTFWYHPDRTEIKRKIVSLIHDTGELLKFAKTGKHYGKGFSSSVRLLLEETSKCKDELSVMSHVIKYQEIQQLQIKLNKKTDKLFQKYSQQSFWLNICSSVGTFFGLGTTQGVLDGTRLVLSQRLKASNQNQHTLVQVCKHKHKVTKKEIQRKQQLLQQLQKDLSLAEEALDAADKGFWDSYAKLTDRMEINVEFSTSPVSVTLKGKDLKDYLRKKMKVDIVGYKRNKLIIKQGKEQIKYNRLLKDFECQGTENGFWASIGKFFIQIGNGFVYVGGNFKF